MSHLPALSRSYAGFETPRSPRRNQLCTAAPPLTEELPRPPDQLQPTQGDASVSPPRLPRAVQAAQRASTAAPLPPEEIARRRRLVYGETDDEARARKLAEVQAKAVAVASARDAAETRRQRAPVALTNPFDPGAPKAAWTREGEQPNSAVVSCSSTEKPARRALSASEQIERPRGRRRARRREREWKLRRKPAGSMADAALRFASDRAWTVERSQRLATRTKKNEAIISHPARAEAELKQLTVWAQAAVRRALRGEGWTFGDEAARRHVAWWATMEDFARERAWSRPKAIRSKSGAVRFAGIAKFSRAVIGWTQSALAIALTGAALTWADADPVDVKTVQRHTGLAIAYGGVQLVAKNPDAPPELRGAPTDSNPKGWAINVYWLPDSPELHKPGFTGRWFDASGNAIGLDEALAIELIPRMKRARRLREERRAQRAEAPPDIG